MSDKFPLDKQASYTKPLFDAESMPTVYSTESTFLANWESAFQPLAIYPSNIYKYAHVHRTGTGFLGYFMGLKEIVPRQEENLFSINGLSVAGEATEMTAQELRYQQRRNVIDTARMEIIEAIGTNWTDLEILEGLDSGLLILGDERQAADRLAVILKEDLQVDDSDSGTNLVNVLVRNYRAFLHGKKRSDVAALEKLRQEQLPPRARDDRSKLPSIIKDAQRLEIVASTDYFRKSLRDVVAGDGQEMTRILSFVRWIKLCNRLTQLELDEIIAGSRRFQNADYGGWNGFADQAAALHDWPPVKPIDVQAVRSKAGFKLHQLAEKRPILEALLKMGKLRQRPRDIGRPAIGATEE